MSTAQPTIPALELSRLGQNDENSTQTTANVTSSTTGDGTRSGRASTSTGSSSQTTRKLKQTNSGRSSVHTRNEHNVSEAAAGWHENISTPSQRAISLSARAQKAYDPQLEDPSGSASTPRWEELLNSKQDLSTTGTTPDLTTRSLTPRQTVRITGQAGAPEPINESMSLFDIASASTALATNPMSGSQPNSETVAVTIPEEVYVDIMTDSANLTSTVESASFEELSTNTRNARITVWLVALALLAASVAAFAVSGSKYDYRVVHISSEFCIAVLILGGIVGVVAAPAACWAAHKHKTAALSALGYISMICAALELVAMLFSLVANRSKIRIRAETYYKRHHPETPVNLEELEAFILSYDDALKSIGVAAVLLVVFYAFLGFNAARIVRKINLHTQALKRASADRKRLAERVQNRKIEAALAKKNYGSVPVEKTLSDIMVLRQG